MHQPQQIAALHTLVTRFRGAIRATDPTEVDPEVRFIVASFPKGVCGAVCFLLGHYLRQKWIPRRQVRQRNPPARWPEPRMD